jgi:hypothetical protein
MQLLSVELSSARTGTIGSAQSKPLSRKDYSIFDYSFFASRKYGSTLPLSRMVSGLPLRSTALPAVTRIQPSLTQYSSTLVFYLPSKRMPMSRLSNSSL